MTDRKTRFYDTAEWNEYTGGGQYSDWPREIRLEFINRCAEQDHADQYYGALDLMGVEGPDWEDLTEEKRQQIRDENTRYAREMHEFGKSLGKL